MIARAQGSILNSDSAAAIRRSRIRGRPLRPVVPTHPPGKLADALRPTGSSTVRIFDQTTEPRLDAASRPPALDKAAILAAIRVAVKCPGANSTTIDCDTSVAARTATMYSGISGLALLGR